MFCFVCPIFRWGFYIHAYGAIDGFSRLIPFLCVVIGNTAKLALTCFIKGIRRRGLPSRIRLDRGSEYNDCARFMEWHRGPGRGSAMRGRSVHNQRTIKKKTMSVKVKNVQERKRAKIESSHWYAQIWMEVTSYHCLSLENFFKKNASTTLYIFLLLTKQIRKHGWIVVFLPSGYSALIVDLLLKVDAFVW